jgi:hydrogenase maturation protease
MKGTVMVIGYGDGLRSDDGIGQRVANAIESWRLSTVQSLAVHQLTPELAATLASADLAIFVDASTKAEAVDVQVRSLPVGVVPSLSSPVTNLVNEHFADPRSLLALTQSLYGHCPSAWWVTIPGINFEFGDRISPTAEQGIAIALVKIIHILDKCKNLWMKLDF